MSKRSREYFESFQEYDHLNSQHDVTSSAPKQKRRKSININDENTNNNDKEVTPPKQIKKSILSESLSPSPSPPAILINNKTNKNNKKLMDIDENKVFDENIFYFANIGIKNKRSGHRKIWDDLNKNRIKVFNNIIPKNGGKIIENINEFDNKYNNLIIIVSAKIKKQEFDQLFDANIQQNKHFIFVTPEFITSSLKYQNKLSLKQFIPNCLNEKQSEKSDKEKEEKQDGNTTKIVDTKQEYKQKSSKPKGNWLDRNKEKFACQIENDGQKMNHNTNITQIFDEMESIYSCLGDKWREYGYKKANGFIKKYPKKIKTENDIKQLIKMKGFSKKLGDKVLEIINTGKLRKLNELKSMPQIKTIKLFINIFGVGATTAQKWYNLGLRTLDDITNDKFDIKLQDRQKMGLKYYDDLLIKIPRSEIREIEKFVSNEINRVCPGCKCIICGSYRRGKLRSGDVDILVTHSISEKTNGLLIQIIDRLHDIGFLVDDLSVPSGHNKHREDHDSYMGIGKLFGDEYKYYRHIDIKVYKPEHFAFAVLYFTGSDHFNRSMRYFAKKKGYTLSDTQLAPAIRMNNTKIFTFTQKAIKCKTEKEIFKALGLKYIKPTDRNTYENFGVSFNQKNHHQQHDNNNNHHENTNNYSNTP